MGVEHHFLRLAWIGPHKHHAAVAEPDMGDLHGYRHAVDQDDLVAPVELVGLARREEQRHIGFCRRRSLCLHPPPRVTPDGIVAALVTEPAKLLIDADQRQPLARRLGLVRREKAAEVGLPWADLRHRLMFALVTELRRIGAQHLADHFPGNPQLPADLLDRLPVNQRKAAYLRNRLHDQHPKQMPPMKPEAV